ncbi:GTP 3',8-cyclase MoaA [Kineococcus sp. SYSU DK004]|uniref:GTP 3',8-cyclase MoaA n=1 Tax=Kineococcus sp. SYSU DK004 TaxID=3383125 RepID=UPI003D7E7A1E
MTIVDLGVPAVRRPAGSAPGSASPAPPAPDSSTGPLRDRYGRTATDLRVSLTDRCNLRCHYCMPPEGLPWLERPAVLTDAEVVRLVTLAVRELGVREVRFTGGEPLLRRGLEDLVAATAALRTADGAPVGTSLTTNGIGLARRAAGLATAGLGRVNVSLDTLDPARFAAITRRDRHADVLAGVEAAAAAGLAPVKVNAVLLRGVNDDEAPALLRWALERGVELRFIEQMPLDPHGTWRREDMITAEEVLASLQGAFTLVARPAAARGSAPAETWDVTDPATGRALGRVGIIASVTRPFCGDCDRTRLTADGQVRTCLFSTTETDLRDALRAGADDAQLAATWRTAMWGKLPGHDIDDPGFLHPTRPMSAIGG